MRGADQVRIAIVGALERELRPLERKIGEQAVYHAMGMGREGVMSELPWFIERYEPKVIILTGFSGGLEPGLRSGMPILAKELRYEGEREVISLENRFYDLAAAALEAARIPFRRGRMLTVARIITTPEEKYRLRKDFSALAVDMEAWWAAQVAKGKGRPLICLKAIVDPAEQGLPGALALREPNREWALLRAPRGWPGLFRLAWAAKRASGALAEAVAPIVEALSQAHTGAEERVVRWA